MTLTRIGGLAALICAATYLIGFALLVTLLAPLGFGTNDIDPAAVLAFDAARPGILTAWNSTIYVAERPRADRSGRCPVRQTVRTTPGWAAVTKGLGLVWAALVLGAGMIANVALERAAHLYPSDPAARSSSGRCCTRWSWVSAAATRSRAVSGSAASALPV
jgi:hypothetical protein